MNNLGRGPLGEAMYQISKAQTFQFQIPRFLKVFSIKVYVKHVDPKVGSLGLLVSDKKIF